MDEILFQKVTTKIMSQLETMNANILRLAEAVEKLAEIIKGQEDETI